ncbi:hypothetical protein AVEN_146577-1, partial [Araneus ventricosus]
NSDRVAGDAVSRVAASDVSVCHPVDTHLPGSFMGNLLLQTDMTPFTPVTQFQVTAEVVHFN